MKNLLPYILSYGLIYSSSFLFAQTSITLQPDSASGKDALVISRPMQVNSNYGASEFLQTGAWTYGGDEGITRSFIAFDLSGIPTSATIDTAILTLTHDSLNTSPWGHSTQSGSNASYIGKITSDWDEMTVTWNNQPSEDMTNKVIITQSTTTYDDYSLDVTTLVQDMVDNPSTSFGFSLRLANEAYYRWMNFASGDNLNPVKRPKLEITYTEIVSIEDQITLRKSFKVAPNPANDIVSIISDYKEPVQFEVFNVIGDKVIGKLNGNKFSVSGLSDGLYFLKTYSAEGLLLDTSKFIKK